MFMTAYSGRARSRVRTWDPLVDKIRRYASADAVVFIHNPIRTALLGYACCPNAHASQLGA